MRFDLADLRLFVHVAEARSITGGAERAGLALASASARIAGMEEVLGTALLVRGQRGVALSAAGECLLAHAREITAGVERMRGDLGSYARGLAGNVRLVANTAAASEHLPGVLGRFLAENPSLGVEVEERESVDIGAAVAAGTADIGIASAAALAAVLEAFPFRDDRLVVAVPRGDGLGNRRRLQLAAIADRAFVGLARDSALERHVAGHAARIGAALRVRARVSGFDAVCAMVGAGAGIAIVPEAAARRCRRAMKLDVVKLDEPWARRRLAICVRDLRALPEGARRLVAHLRAQAAGVAPG